MRVKVEVGGDIVSLVLVPTGTIPPNLAEVRRMPSAPL